MHAFSPLAADAMSPSPPAVASSTATGQEGLFSSRLKSAADKQATATRSSEVRNQQPGSASADKPPLASGDFDGAEKQENMTVAETSLNGSAGALLQQSANISPNELIAAGSGSSVNSSPAQNSESAVARMLNLLTTNETAAGAQNDAATVAARQTAATHPAGPGGDSSSPQSLANAPQSTPTGSISSVTDQGARGAGTSENSAPGQNSASAVARMFDTLTTTGSNAGAQNDAAPHEEGTQQNGPLIIQNKYGQVIAVYQAGEAEEETAIAGSPGKTNPSAPESQRLDVNSNYIRSHLPNEASPKTAEEDGDRQQDSPTQFRHQEGVNTAETRKEGQMTGEQSMAPKGLPTIGPENQPLLFAQQRSSAQAPVTSSTVESSMFRLPSGSAVPEGSVVDQMIAHFSVNKRLETGTVNLKLYPQELGELRMEIKVNQDNIKAHIIAQNPQAQEMIDRHLPRLREALAQQGLHLQQVEVTLAAHDNTGGERFQESSAWRQPTSSRHHNSPDRPVFSLETDESGGEDHSIANTLSVLA